MINKNQSGGARDNINGVRKINTTVNDLFNEDSVNMTSDSLGIANILQNRSQIGGRKSIIQNHQKNHQKDHQENHLGDPNFPVDHPQPVEVKDHHLISILK